MSLIVHRAPRADHLADGLADLLRTPLDDPFAQELVLVPARGRRALAQPAALPPAGHAEGRDDGVCAGVEFRSPASLVAEVTGTRGDDPWAPDALVWPLLDGDRRQRRRGLGAHPQPPPRPRPGGRGGRAAPGSPLRGRPAAGPAVRVRTPSSGPTLLADWERHDDTDGAGGALPTDLTWQPELWRRLVAEVGEPTPGAAARARGRGAAPRRRTPTTCRRGSRCSGTPGSPSPRSSCSPRSASTATSTSGCPTRRRRCGTRLAGTTGRRRRAEPTTPTCSVGHPLLASLGRDVRELQRTLHGAGGSSSRRRGVSTTRRSTPRPTTLLGWLQHDLAANATADRAARPRPGRPQRPGARLPRPGPAGRGAARGAARPARRRPHRSSRATSW